MFQNRPTFFLLVLVHIISHFDSMKQTTTSIQNSIKVLLRRGLSQRKIATRLGVGLGTVSKYKKLLAPDIPEPKRGRVQKITESGARLIGRKFASGAYTNVAAVHREMQAEGISVSYHTLYRMLKKLGFKAARKQKKPRLTKKHKMERLRWANEHKDWTVDDWKRVAWSDETKINRFGSDGAQWYWKQKGEPLKEHHISPQIKYGGGSLMMWGCITYEGVGYGCQIEGSMDSDIYCEILGKHLMDTMEYYGISEDTMIFQHDNDRKHTSRTVKAWLHDKGVEVLPWPACSPDLNPIEHMWYLLKCKLGLYKEPPKSIHELWERVDHEWNKIDPDLCRSLVDSMPRRVRAVIRAKGGHTMY